MEYGTHISESNHWSMDGGSKSWSMDGIKSYDSEMMSQHVRIETITLAYSLRLSLKH